ncbi:MAG TPA: hypothetical protein VF521_13805, partial [Pyrinomonadaceae bacterium]
MAKELIVSVNGREKKIAIIEDEQVTEFYIERGEENQGIVGNIYKGRVMRVLPGMQSAFVDIGLERDAFLYVSDFFDEEEEFERIVLDKTKKTDSGAAERAAREQIEQARVEREQHIEATQERLEPLNDAGPAASLDAEEEAATAAAVTAQSAEPVEARPADSSGSATAATAPQGEETEEGVHRRGRRGRRRGKGSKEQQPEAASTDAGAPGFSSALDTDDIGTPFAAAASDFQRVVDEEEVAAENGAMFKDARLQERIFDQIHAVEFDMEAIQETEVGSLLNTGLQADASFQRIDDSDIASADEGREGRSSALQQTVAAHVSDFIDEVTTAAPGSQSFERVSDDEKFAEGVGVEEAPQTTETTARGGGRASKATQRGARKGRATKSDDDDQPTASAADEEAAK